MKSARFLIMFAFLVLAPAVRGQAADPEKRIVGHWQGLGMGMMIETVFNADHTFFHPDEPGETGTWSYKNGTYSIRTKNARHEGKFDSEGRLVLKNLDVPGLEVAYRKKEELAVMTPIPNQAAPAGQWRFAYTRRSSIQAAPPFDVMTFSPGKVKLEFTPAAQSFDINCQVSNGIIGFATGGPKMFTNLIGFTPLGRQLPARLNFTYRYEENGNLLVLANAQAAKPFDCEWAFMRPEQFPANKIAGLWVGKGSVTGTQMEMRPDGTVSTTSPMSPPRRPGEPQLPVQYYRLWKSPLGDAISICQLVPGMELVHIQMARYEISGREIILTPIECEYGETLKLAPGKSSWKFQGINDKPQPAVKNAGTTRTLTAFDIAGEWVGKTEGYETSFTFNPDGAMVWRSTEPQFRMEAAAGIKGRFKLSKPFGLNSITFYGFDEDSPLEDREIEGICELLDDNHLKIEMNLMGAPLTEFSVEAVVFQRKGPKPKIDAK